MGSYDTFGDRFGVDQDTIDALNARYGEPMDMADQGAGTGVGGYVRSQAEAAGIPTKIPTFTGKERAALEEVKKDEAAAVSGKEWLENHRQQVNNSGKAYVSSLDLANAQEAQGKPAPPSNGEPRRMMTRAEAGAAGINPTDDAPGAVEAPGQLTGGSGGGGAAPYVGWIPKQRQAEFGYSQEELAPVRQAVGERQESMERAGETGNALATQKDIVDTAKARAYAAATELYADHLEQNRAQKEHYVDNELRRLNQLSVATQKDVDPDDYWKRLGTGGSFMAALAVGLGQFGAALTGGTNAAMQLIQSNVDRNINAQVRNQEQANKAYDTGVNLYARNLEAFGDRDRAIAATRVNYMDRIGAELDAILADESRPLMERKRAQDLKTQVLADREREIKGFTTLSHTKLTQADAFGSMGGGGGDAGPGKALENTVQLADGTVVQLDGTAQANEVAKTLGYHSQMQQLDQRALKLRNELAGLDPVGDRVKYQSVYRELEMAGKDRSELSSQAKGQGVITKEDAKREEAVGLNYTQGYGGNVATGTFRSHIDPTAKGDREIGNNTIRSSIERSGQQERALVTAHRGRIIRGEYQRDAAGNLKPVDRYTGQDPHPTEHRAPNGFTPISPDARVPTRGTSLSEDTPHAPVTAAPAGGASGGGVTFNIVGGGGKRGGGGGGKRKRK